MNASNYDIITPSDWVISDSIIKVMGVGGGGCNAVSYMFNQKIEGCSFVVCNTDSQALHKSPVPCKVQMGKGLGAGTDPIKGRNAALSSQDRIVEILSDNTQMLFITAGMGGGTGTGATPVIAKLAKDRGILTVAVVTIPFRNEGSAAYTRAIEGIEELEQHVDSLLIIDNEKLYDYYGDLLVHDAFPKADEVLSTAVKGIIEIIKKPGFINVDFEDVKTMMRDSGMALMGCGIGSGPDRIEDAVHSAFESPLLNDFDLKTAKNVLVNICTGRNEQGLKMNDLDQINEKICEYTGNANNFKRGLICDDDPDVGDTIHITAIATGFKISSLIGPDNPESNYISISPDYTYRKWSEPGEISLPDPAQTIKTPSSDSTASYVYDADRKPVLLASSGEEINELENTPAITRK
ncbi:MAG: cell division protein FtsZ [Bacteroidales bacterium]|nr:cell division protein FtsZ [Bacteroidales bacterium]